MPVLLNKQLWFPDPRRVGDFSNESGLVAVGGDLSVPRLLLAYRSGIFPWSVNPITWWSPNLRAVIELDCFHVSRSLSRTLRKGEFHLTIDAAFESVIRECAASGRGRETTWISPEFIDAYLRLFDEGHAHSIESWINGELVGGVYGVSVGGVFCGESMFYHASNASKVALHFLVQHLRQRGFGLFDIQMITPVTLQLGACTISRNHYLERLREAIAMPCGFV